MRKNARDRILSYLFCHSAHPNLMVALNELILTQEFYEVTESSPEVSEPRAELLEWERTYNVVRPHQALGYMTPLKLLEQWKEKQRKEVMMCH